MKPLQPHFKAACVSAWLALFLMVPLPSCATANSGVDGGDEVESDAPIGSEIDADTPSGPDANVCAQSPCTILPQCGCPGAACDLDRDSLEEGGLLCREVSVPGDNNSSCAAGAECAAGFVCLGGQCRNYCDAQNACTGGQCLVEPVYDSGGGVFEPIPGVTACTKDCSPEQSTDNGCPSTPQFGCHLVNYDPDGTPDNGDEFYYSDCRSTPTTGGGDGFDCAGLGDPGCQAGFECVGLGGESVCKQLCVVPGGPCGAGTCSSFVDPVTISGVEYGVCL